MRFEEHSIIYENLISEVPVGSDFIRYFPLFRKASHHAALCLVSLRMGLSQSPVWSDYFYRVWQGFGNRSICVRSTRNESFSCVILMGCRIHHWEPRETVSASKSSFPSLVLNGKGIVLQFQHHSQKPAWSSTQRILENGLPRLMIGVDRYVKLST